MSRKHTLHKKELLSISGLPLGAGKYLKGTASSKMRKLRHPGHPCALGEEVLTTAILAKKEPPSSSCGASGPQDTALSHGSKKLSHPLSPKGKSICRPDWRSGSPGKARAWLMYRKMLHRGHCGGADDFQTVSMELPTETLKKRRPEFGNKTFLALESRLEDDMNIPLKARAANYQRKKILKRNAGIEPWAGHEDYKWYRQCCKACKNHY